MNWVFEAYSNVYNVAMKSMGLSIPFVSAEKSEKLKGSRLSRRNR
jgi:hypothetical protein